MSPVTITINEYGGDNRQLVWTRADRDDLTDRGTWSGDPGWVQAAETALLTRSDVLVAHPGLYYQFGQFTGDLPVEEVAAAMIAAASARGDCTEAVAELPADLFDDDAPEGVIY